MHHHQHWRGGGHIPFEDEEVPGYADNLREPTSRVDVDSLEPEYNRRLKEGVSMVKSTKPLPPPPPLSPPPPSCLSSDCPPPPPPPPKKFSKIIPVTRLANNSRRKSRVRKSRNAIDNFPHTSRGAFAWSVTSSMYWKLLVILQLVFCMADVVQDGTIMLYYQRIFLMFLFSTAIAIIVGMYVYTMYTKSPSTVAETNGSKSHANQLQNRSFADTELGGSLSSTLRRAYIRRQALCRTNFHLRLGAVVFGIATLIYYGFEISVHATNKRASCVDDVVYALPILLVVLCFLQIHFLFVNSQVLVGSLRGPAQFCFAHMLATNLALWLKMVGSQSVMNWVAFMSEMTITTNDSTVRVWWPRSYQPIGNVEQTDNFDGSFGGLLRWSAVVPPEFGRISAFTECLHNTTLGQMWLQATPFLVPFLLQFCVVSAAVFYVLWASMSTKSSSERDRPADTPLCRKVSTASQCQMENKGIFVGLLLLVGGIVVLVMYLILRAEPQFFSETLWVVSGTTSVVTMVLTLALLIAFVKIQGVAYARDPPRVSQLDMVLTSVTSVGPLLFSVLGIVASTDLNTNSHVLVFTHAALLLIEATLQNVFVAERWRRVPNRGGQQTIQAMLFANAALWLLDTFMTSSGDSQKLQEQFYGPLLWGILSYSSTPLIALYRFHSTIQLYELWKRSHT